MNVPDGLAALSIASASGLGDGFEACHRPPDDGKVNVHAGFHQRCGHQTHRLGIGEALANDVQSFPPVLSAHGRRKMHGSIPVWQRQEELASVPPRVDDAQHLAFVGQPRRQFGIVDLAFVA